MNFRRRHVSVGVCIGAILFSGGCALREKIPESAPTPIPVIIPLPRIVEDYPAPANTPGLDVAETAQADAPNNPKANLTLGYAYFKAKAYADAARVFDKAAVLSPSDPTPLLYLGYTQMAVGALDSALATFEKALTLPGVSALVKSDAHLQIGNIRGAFNDPDQAMKAFQISLKENPKQGKAMIALAARAAELKRMDEAKRLFTEAVAVLPPGRHQAQALASLGRLAEQKGDKAGALTAYKKAATLDDENAWASEGVARLTKK